MRYLVLVCALAAIGVGAWFLIGDDPSEPTDVVTTDGDGGDEAQPGLEGMGVEGDGPAPDAMENPGRGEIVGTVRYAGAPTPAHVELRAVAKLEGDGAAALFDVLGKVFVDRLLDGGVARGGALDHVEAGDDGAFRFRGLGPGLYEVRARDAQDRRAVASISVPADRARVSLTIDLPSGDVSFAGRVVFDDGTPFRGTVIVSPGMNQMGPFMPARGPQAQTDTEGKFAIGGLAPGVVMVTAVAPGSIRAMGLPVTLPYKGDYTLTIGAGGVPVKGRVVEAETMTPIPGATVLAGGGNPGTGFLLRTTTADAEGRFELKIPGTEGGMIAMAEGYGTGMVELRGERPEDEITVPLPKLATLYGQLTAKESGEPLPGVPVYAVPADGGMDGFTFPASTVTDAEGRYRMEDVPPGTSMVFAFGDGWVGEALPSLRGRRDRGGAGAVLLKPAEEKEKDLVAVPAGKVEGRVTTGGKPIGGAVVSLERQNDFMMQIGFMLGMGSGFVTGVTDRDGRYVIDAVVPDDDVRLTTKAVGFAAKQTDPFRVASGETATHDFELEAARWMTVTVVDADSGEPIANALVVGTMKKATESGSVMARLSDITGGYVTTDAKGRARIGPLAAGVAGARAQAGGYLKDNDFTWFEADATEGTLKLRRGLEISGTIELPPGLAASQVEIRARYSGEGGWQREETAPQADGTFVVTGLKEGPYRVSARAALPGKRFEALVEGVEAGATDVTLVLTEVERGSMLTIKVVDAKGTPVTRARISMQRTWKSGGTSSSSRSLSAGRATFELDDDREPDAAFVEIFRVEGGQGGALYQRLDEYGGGTVELRLNAAESIRGRVTAAGKPVAGVQVTAWMLKPGTERETTNEHATTVTGDDGRYTLEGLGPYAYEVRFGAPSQYVPVPPQTHDAGSTGADAALEVGATAVITVLDDEGQPVSGAYVYLYGIQGDNAPRRWSRGNFNATSDSRGEAKLEGLPPGGTFRLGVNPPNARKDLRPAQQEEWTPAPTTVRLERAYGITGTVLDKAGRPLADGDVRAKAVGGDGRQYSANVDREGRFELKNMPPGEYEVWYEADGVLRTFGSGEAEPTRQRVRAGSQDVTVRADLGLSLTVKIANWSSDNRWQQAQLNQEDGRGNAWRQVGADGVVRFHGLVEGKTYTFAITGLPGGRFVYKTGLRPGDTSTLRVETGRPITGRVRIPADAEGGRISVSVQGTGFGIGSEVDKDGRFKIEGVPDGTWKVQAWAQKDGAQWYAQTEAAPGGDVELVLERRR